MHANQLAELAALVATNSTTIFDCTDPIATRGAERYWAASKCRLERWTRSLKSHGLKSHGALESDSITANRQATWKTLSELMEEILTSEILTRIWVAAAALHDRAIGRAELQPIARSVMSGHLEARNRVLNLLVFGRGLGMREVGLLNQLRRRCERWTDLLLGCLPPDRNIRELAFDVRRTRGFADELQRERRSGDGLHASQTVLDAMRAAFQNRWSSDGPNADLNEQIANSVLSCLRADLFDSTGMFSSLWMMRLCSTANQTQVLLDELMFAETSVPSARR